MMNAQRCNNLSENKSNSKIQIPQLKKVQTGNEQYVLQEVKPWKLHMHAQYIHIDSSRYSRVHMSHEVFLFLLRFWFCELLSTQTEERKMAMEQGYSDTVYSRTISYQ